jgi:hypothetical protein
MPKLRNDSGRTLLHAGRHVLAGAVVEVASFALLEAWTAIKRALDRGEMTEIDEVDDGDIRSDIGRNLRDGQRHDLQHGDPADNGASRDVDRSGEQPRIQRNPRRKR